MCGQIPLAVSSAVPPPTSPSWLASSAVEIAALIQQGAVSSETVVSAHLARVADINPAINAVVQVCGELALAAAGAADRALAAGDIVGPLHGVPITVKDSFDTAGIVPTAGTLGRRDFVPTADATIVRRLKAAGAIVIGKTNTPELTLAYEANNLIYVMTRNPYDLSRGTGGSSGGAAAIVAACGSALDVGSDTAGSIRFPAHCCGVAGIKPTSGRVSRTGHVIGPAGVQQWLTVVGPIARRVADLELALRVMAGPDGQDPHIVPMPLGESRRVDLRGLRAAVFADTPLAKSSSDVHAAVDAAAHALAAAGVDVDQATPPDFERAFAYFPKIFGADGAAGLEGYLAALGTTELSPEVQGAVHLMRAQAMSSAAFGDLLFAIDLWRADMLAFMQRYDLIICPAAADAAPQPVTDWLDTSIAWNARIFPFLVPFNFTGAPSVVVRTGSSMHLPIGVQCVARPWRDDVALRAAAEIEAVLGGWRGPESPEPAVPVRG